MSPETERLIRESWEKVSPRSDELASVFYARLFSQSAQAASLFTATNMAEQRKKLVLMLTEIVRVIDQPKLLISEVSESGRRHKGYGVQERDYRDVGVALLQAFEETLGKDFTPEVRSAWKEAYDLLASVMRRSATAAD